MAGLLLAVAAGNTITASIDAPVGSNCLVIADNVEAKPSIGVWTVELIHRCPAIGRTIVAARTTARVRAGDSLTVPGARRIAAIALAPTDGIDVQVSGDGSIVDLTVGGLAHRFIIP